LLLPSLSSGLPIGLRRPWVELFVILSHLSNVDGEEVTIRNAWWVVSVAALHVSRLAHQLTVALQMSARVGNGSLVVVLASDRPLVHG